MLKFLVKNWFPSSVDIGGVAILELSDADIRRILLAPGWLGQVQRDCPELQLEGLSLTAPPVFFYNDVCANEELDEGLLAALGLEGEDDPRVKILDAAIEESSVFVLPDDFDHRVILGKNKAVTSVINETLQISGEKFKITATYGGDYCDIETSEIGYDLLHAHLHQGAMADAFR